MTRSIAVVGAGISGLHLALRLRQLGGDVVLYTSHTPADLGQGPPPNLVTRLGSTRARERALGLDRWASSEFDNRWMHLRIEGADIEFRAELPHPGSSVDFRLYLPSLLETYEERGGRVDAVVPPDPETLAGRHDLVVFATGRTAPADLFPRDPARSPFTTAPRSLAGGLFTGVEPPDPPGMAMTMVPGVGEIHTPTYHSFGGTVTAILVEAVPGGPFTELTGTDLRAEPALFAEQVLALITKYAPALRERVDEREFAPAREVDILQGALVPTVRRGWAELADGRGALAIGDAWILNDPLTAQGANLGSAQAFTVAEAIVEHDGPLDSGFCRALSERLWSAAQPVVDWTNAFLAPPPPHVLDLFRAAATDQRVADAFVAWLDRPDLMWRTISDPDRTAQLISNGGHL